MKKYIAIIITVIMLMASNLWAAGSCNDEIKMLRIGPSDETSAYNAYVEECRAWGRGEKEKIK